MRLLRMIWVGSKCNHKGPYKRDREICWQRLSRSFVVLETNKQKNWSDVSKGLWTKKCKKALEIRKATNMESPLLPLVGTNSATTLILALSD